MERKPVITAVLGAAALAACGRPDASGLYLSKTDRAVTLVQISQTQDGAVAGRLEDLSIGPGGQVNDRSANLSGGASRHDLTLKPAGPWFAGASGSFSRDGLELAGKAFALKARRSTLKEYQTAVTRLEINAQSERLRITDARAGQAASEAAATPLKDAPDRVARLQAAAADLTKAAADLNAGIDGAPDFRRQSAQNTAQVEQLARMAAGGDRSQAIASANQIVLAANQIEVARTRYAIGLNQIVQKGAPLATEIQRFCASAEAEKLAAPCAQAAAAATVFQSAEVRAFTVFNGQKRAIQDDLARQNELVRKMGG